MKIVLESIIESIASRVDGTVNIKIGTQELDPSKAGELFSLRGKYCKVLISDTNITTLEEEMIDNSTAVATKKNKTEGQRLRAVLYRYWEQNGGEMDSEAFYKMEMEKIISHFKNKLG